VAAKCGISNAQLSRIETGRSTPNRGTLEKIAPVLGVSAAYLDAEALSDAVAERATDPEARAVFERLLALHDRIALMSRDQREELLNVLDALTTASASSDENHGADGGER
jgi:transcriptional regulator with XRE-family HTH domain